MSEAPAEASPASEDSPKLPKSIAVVVAVLTAAAPLTAGIMQAGSAYVNQKDSEEAAHKQIVDAMLNAESSGARQRLLRYIAKAEVTNESTQSWAAEELKIEEKDEAQLIARNKALATELTVLHQQTHTVLSNVLDASKGLPVTKRKWEVAHKRLANDDISDEELLALVAEASQELAVAHKELTELRTMVERQVIRKRVVEETGQDLPPPPGGPNAGPPRGGPPPPQR